MKIKIVEGCTKLEYEGTVEELKALKQLADEEEELEEDNALEALKDLDEFFEQIRNKRKAK